MSRSTACSASHSNKLLAIRYGTRQCFAFRMEQLDLRRFEIYSVWNAFKKLVTDGDHEELTNMDDIAIDWAAFHDKVDFSSVQFVGHSFGGATVFHILSTPPDEGFSPLPISHALFLDPWLLPFRMPGPKPINPDSGTKTLILHSEEFTLHMPGFLNLMLGNRLFWSNPPTYTIGEYNFLQVTLLLLLTVVRSRLQTYKFQRLHDHLAKEMAGNGFLDNTQGWRSHPRIP